MLKTNFIPFLINFSRSFYKIQNVHIPDCIPSGQAWINDEAELSIPSIVVPEIVVPLSEEVRQHVRDMIPGNSIRLQEARELYLNIRNFVNIHLDSD